MEHLDFVNKLNDTGISLRSTNIEGKVKEYEIFGIFGHSNMIIEKDFNLYWKSRDDRNPFIELVKKAIDMDSWKHSWHNEITSENYEKFMSLIQDKILERASQIEFLLDVYFLIRKAEIDNKRAIIKT